MKMQNNNPKRGKKSAFTNFSLLTAIVVGLSAYLTVKSSWNIGTAAAVVILGATAAFYFWLWRSFGKDI